MIALDDRVSDPVGSGWVLAGALAFFMAGCAMLVFGGASLGALHAFAAFIVLAVVAALNQLLPVLTHAPVARPQAVLAAAGGFAVGFVLLIAGFFGAPTFASAGLVLSLAAVGWVLWNVARLWAGKAEMQTRTLVACALAAFALAAGLGGWMACTLSGACAAPIGALVPLHATLAIGGFASLLVVAVSYRFVPMFAVAHGDKYGRRAMQWVAVASVALVAMSLRSPWALRAGLVGMLFAATGIAASHRATLATRLRKRIDVSLWYGSVGWILGMLALVTAIAATWTDALQVSWVVLAVMGWISITIFGYAFKIAGFLAWQVAKERDSVSPLPPLSTAVNLPLAYTALALLVCGSLLSAALNATFPEYVRVGFGIYAVGGAGALAALVRLTTLYVLRKQPDGTI